MPAQRSHRAGVCGCLALFHAARAPASRLPEGGGKGGEKAHVEAHAPPRAPDSHVVLQQQVQAMVTAEMRGLQESLGRELQGVLGRLRKADTTQQAGAEAAAGDEDEGPLLRRGDFRRRWTCAADGADSLSSILRRTASTESDAEHGGEHSCAEDALQTRMSVVRYPSETSCTPADAEELPVSRRNTDEHNDMEVGSFKSGSSVVWRMDALDCGDRLAASAAAKKGSASVDSIVELVESERARWAEEKVVLEARLEELKEQRQLSRRCPDAEKQALKQQVQELRETMKLRSRFGAWVCERHMQESDDEGESPGSLEKEELRQVMASLQAEIRDARAKAAADAERP
eukprot:CAMPEP_0204516528 /NCGR_PEP_ID=MMETSP0661-20131031/3192_1 /ASSEMBLY_ACC=CAM_ASM_000606 /TAXON_ID=109239 /ORGANISM="Alexandrium margalefi, Strain AMGDE01CS-322" /LENGTH=344 /DNA_ID=CAMNT_0051521891 /DNA_START=36 /DNA_END=1070 /DNA_ORIENTATION=-